MQYELNKQKTKLITLLVKHSSLALMLLGVGLQLLTSIVLYEKLNSTDYAQFGQWLTFITAVSSFGLLGVEQSFLRTTHAIGNNIHIPKNVAFFIFYALCIGPAVLSFVFSYYWNQSFISLYVLALPASAVMFFYNFLRISKSFTLAQLINNLFRYFLLVILLYIAFSLSIDAGDIYNTIFFGFVVALIFATGLVKAKYNIKKAESVDSLLGLTFSFMFSMAILTGLSSIDRFLVGGIFSKDEFARYFLLYNIFFSPFSIIGSYVGFKRLVTYKENFSFAFFNQALLKIFIRGLVFSGAYVITVWFVAHLIQYPLDIIGDINTIIALVILGLMRLIYSELSAAMGAMGNKKIILVANIASLILLIAAVVFFELFHDISLSVVAWASCLLWFMRDVFYYIGVKQIALKI